MTDSKQGKIITFYSYKGGTGRSMAVANIAWILAANGKRVLVVDWDLEAPGLQRYFRPFLVDRELTSSPGVVDLITDFILEAITPLEKGEKLAADWFVPRTDIDPYVISLNWKFPAPGQLDFIPAGRQGPDYAQRFGAINWQKFYDVLGGGAFIEQLKINLRSQYDYILVDSRTGVSDTSGICTIQLPDTLVVCFTFNNQSIEGAASITQGVYEQRTVQDSHSSLSSQPTKDASSGPVVDAFYRSPYRFKIFPVPMRVDQSEKDKLGIRRTYARRKFDPFLDRKTVIDKRAFWGAVAVPYVPYFSYEEILAAFKDDPTDPSTCLAAFTRIATEITDRDVTGFVPLISPEQREAVLQEFASVPLPELVAGTGSAGDGRVANAGSSRNVGGTGSAEAAETELESSLRRAEATLRSLNEEEREQARLLWMHLVRIPRPGENIENSKVRVPLSEIPADYNPVIQKFANAGVITVSRDDQAGDATVEVKQEELLRSWPTLDQWIRENRGLMLWRQDLRSSMAQWQERGKHWFNLLTGIRFLKALRWYRSHRKYLSNDEAAYIKASISLLIRVYVVTLAIILVSAVIYFYKTRLNKTSEAESIASIAETQITSAKQGTRLASDQFQLGVLLATEAQQLAPNAKAEALLKAELARLPRRLGSFDAKNNVLGLALSPSGTQVLSVTGIPRGDVRTYPEDWTAQLNDVSTAETIIRVSLRESEFELSRDARHVAIAATRGTITMVEVRELMSGKIWGLTTTQFVDMAFSPDGTYFALASGDKRVRLVSLRQTDKGTSSEFASAGTVTALSFSGDSQNLAVARENSVVQIVQNISRSTFPEPVEINIGTTDVVQIALSHDARYLATVIQDGTVKLWDVPSERLVWRFDTGQAVSSVWFTADSKFLVFASPQGIYVSNLATPEARDSRFQKEPNSWMIVPQDGKYFASALPNLARIWEYDGSSFKEVAVLLPRSNLVLLSFGDPNFVVAATADNLITVSKLGEPLTDNLRDEACSRLTRNMTIDEWNQHVAGYLGAYRKTCSELP